MLAHVLVIATMVAIFVSITWTSKHHVLGVILIVIVGVSGTAYDKYTKRNEVPLVVPSDCMPAVQQASPELAPASNSEAA
jgi:glucose uptake protein GlcU